MTQEEFRVAFDNLKNLRFERLSKGYLVESENGPVNAGYFRDNVLDILEELADVVNIAEIRIGRFEEALKGRESDPAAQREAQTFFSGISQVVSGVLTALNGIWLIDSEQDASYRTESVVRDVTREEVGL